MGEARERDLLAKARNLGFRELELLPRAVGLTSAEKTGKVAWGHVKGSQSAVVSRWHNPGNPRASSKELRGGKQMLGTLGSWQSTESGMGEVALEKRKRKDEIASTRELL